MKHKNLLYTTAMVGGALLALPSLSFAQGIISNGTIMLGVDTRGQLNIGGGAASVQGNTTVGLRYLKAGIGELEYTADGCVCEGWGVADGGTGLTGYANNAAGIAGLSEDSFASDATTATTVNSTGVSGGVQFKVTHAFKPSSSANLYQVDVTVENIGSSDASDLRYRRVMDWDIEPTAFSELVSIAGWPATALLGTSDNGFQSGDPLSSRSGIIAPDDSNFTGSGPADHGALFDFGFGGLAVGASKTFTIFYGGADNEAMALGALGTVGAEVYSLAMPNIGSDDERFSVAIFGFKGVGGRPVDPTVPDVPEPGTYALLAGLAASGSSFLLRRRNKK